MKRIDLFKHLNNAANKSYAARADPPTTEENEDILFQTIRDVIDNQKPEQAPPNGAISQFIIANWVQLLISAGISLPYLPLTWWAKFGYFLAQTSGWSQTQIVALIDALVSNDRPNDPHQPLPDLSEGCARAIKHLIRMLTELQNISPSGVVSVLLNTPGLVGALVACYGLGGPIAAALRRTLAQALLEKLFDYLIGLGMTPEQIRAYIEELVDWILGVGGENPPVLPIPNPFPNSPSPRCINGRDYLKDLNRFGPENGVAIGQGIIVAATIAAAVAALVLAWPAIIGGTATVGSVLSGMGLSAESIAAAAAAAGFTGLASADQVEAYLTEEAGKKRNCEDEPSLSDQPDLGV